MVRKSRGFTLIELLIVIVILIVLSGLVYLTINPLEAGKRGRDAIRLSDMKQVFNAVHVVIELKGEPSPALLCDSLSVPCSGTSLDTGDVRKNDGSGWVKVNLDSVSGAGLPTLPADPLAVDPHKYRYFSDGYNFEIDCVFESEEFKQKMRFDGGNNDNYFELGTKLTLL